MKEKTATGILETSIFAQKFAQTLTPLKNAARVIALYGELGSGKTSFVQGTAKALGVDATVISPTFVIERVYKLNHAHFDRLLHLDCYRLETSAGLRALGWNEKIAHPRNLIFVEWAERVEELLPQNTTRIYFEFVSENERNIHMV